MSQDLSTTNLVNLIVFITTGLQMVETCAYLMVVTCLGHALYVDTEAREEEEEEEEALSAV